MAPIKYSSLVPRISYGFHIGASYKGFDFSVMFQGVGQYSKYYSGRGIFEEEGSKYYLDICDNRWNEERYANGGENHASAFGKFRFREPYTE